MKHRVKVTQTSTVVRSTVVEVEAKSLKSAIAHLKGHGTDVLEIPDKAWVEEDNIWESEEYEGADS